MSTKLDFPLKLLVNKKKTRVIVLPKCCQNHKAFFFFFFFLSSLLTIYALNNEHNASGYACALQ